MPRRSDYRHSDIATAEEALARLSVDQLRALARLLPKARRPGRKAELIAEIERYLAGDLLRRLWARLGETEQLAVREALHGPTGEFSPRQFRAKYRRLPAGAGATGGVPGKPSNRCRWFFATPSTPRATNCRRCCA